MNIIIKEVNGIVVGYNTETNSYCNLPEDYQYVGNIKTDILEDVKDKPKSKTKLED